MPRGYYNNEQATRETFVGEWLRTGDIMRVDDNGNFWVTDRLKEVFNPSVSLSGKGTFKEVQTIY